jgi:uncharacterized Zn finger protein
MEAEVVIKNQTEASQLKLTALVLTEQENTKYEVAKIEAETLKLKSNTDYYLAVERGIQELGIMSQLKVSKPVHTQRIKY